MKKFLLILLLLFPVHGAWGEIYTIVCSRISHPGHGGSTYVIDTTKKTATNLHGRAMEMKVTKISYIWETFIVNPDKSGRMLQTSLNRNTGELLADMYEFTETQLKRYLLKLDDLMDHKSVLSVREQCKKSKGKKF